MSVGSVTKETNRGHATPFEVTRYGLDELEACSN